MASTNGKNNWACFLMMLCGIVLGGFIGYLTKDISFLSWMNFGQTFGLEQPIVLNLGIMVLTFGLTIHISVASIIGMILAIIIYKKL